MQGQKKDNEWYTRAVYTSAARQVMGNIDLDPASCTTANQITQASRFYTKEQDGLTRDWTCCSMWLNPPYGLNENGKSNIELWSGRLLREYERGAVQQAILLCMSNTESSWFVPLWQFPICFPSPRVMFHRPNGSMDHHLSGSCFVYLGPHEQKFADIFSQFGAIAKAIKRKPQPTIQPVLWSLLDNQARDTSEDEVSA